MKNLSFVITFLLLSSIKVWACTQLDTLHVQIRAASSDNQAEIFMTTLRQVKNNQDSHTEENLNCYLDLLYSWDEEYRELTPVQLSEAQNIIGYIYYRMGLLDEARELYLATLQTNLAGEYLRYHGEAFNSLGILSSQESDYSTGIKFYIKALDVWNQVGNIYNQTAITVNIGTLQKSLTDFT